MSDDAQLLILFAAVADPAGAAALRTLRLPNLERLLARLAPAERDGSGAQSLSMPHEQVIARLCGLPGDDGRIPLAAWDLRRRGNDPGADGCAWITPCHWQVGAEHVQMQAPAQLQLAERHAAALFEAMRPYFEQDGLSLWMESPSRWTARGELFERLALASLDRVCGRVIDAWQPRGPEGRPLRRLQQEMQMLLYTHAVNDERARQGLAPVNSFWASGAGALPAGGGPGMPAGLVVDDSLREPALLQDWPAWAAAWQRIDSGPAARLLRQLQKGRRVAVTLCGERHAITWRSERAGWGRHVTSLWSRRPVAESAAEL